MLNTNYFLQSSQCLLAHIASYCVVTDCVFSGCLIYVECIFRFISHGATHPSVSENTLERKLTLQWKGFTLMSKKIFSVIA